MKEKTKSQLRKDLDKIFSLYIRQRYANEYGIVRCYTCPKTSHWKKMQCSHFVPRQYLATRYDEVNCQVGCYACNMLYNGQPSAFAKNLERGYGKGTVEMLEAKRQKVMPSFDYVGFIEIYKEKLKNL